MSNKIPFELFKKLALEAVKYDVSEYWLINFTDSIDPEPSTYCYLPDTLKKDIDIAITALKHCPEVADHLPKELQTSPEFQKQCKKLKLNSTAQNDADKRNLYEKIISLTTNWNKDKAPERIIEDKELAIETLRNDGSQLEFVTDILKSDKQVVLTAVRNNGYALEYAAEHLKFDREIVLEAIKTDSGAFEYASESLKSDRDFCLPLIKEDLIEYEDLSHELQANREIALIALSNKRLDLIGYYFNDSVPQSLKSDNSFILALLETNKSFDVNTLNRLTPNQLNAIRGMIENSEPGNNSSEPFIPVDFQDDEDVLAVAVQIDGLKALPLASERLKNNKKLVLLAIQSSVLSYSYASEQVRSDKEVIRAAIVGEVYGGPLDAVPHSALTDKDFVIELLKQNSSIYGGIYGSDFEVLPAHFKDDKEVASVAVETDRHAYKQLNDDLKIDKQIALKAMKINGLNLAYAPDALKIDSEILHAAIRENGIAIHIIKDLLKEH